MCRLFRRFRDPRTPQEHKAAVFAGPLIQLLVGSKEGSTESFYIHEQLLPKQGFFEAALKKQWKEGQQGTINLPEEDSKLFFIYVQWLYTKCLHVLERDENDNIRDGTDYAQLAHLYALGQRMLDTTFQNRVLDAFIAGMIEFNGIRPGAESVDIIYKATPRNSPGRKFMVALYVDEAMSFWFDEESGGSYNHEFLVDLTKALLDEPSHKNSRDPAVESMDPLEDFLKVLSWPDYQFAKAEAKKDTADDTTVWTKHETNAWDSEISW